VPHRTGWLPLFASVAACGVGLNGTGSSDQVGGPDATSDVREDVPVDGLDDRHAEGGGSMDSSGGDAPVETAADDVTLADSAGDAPATDAAEESPIDQSSPEALMEAGPIVTITGGSYQTYGPDAGLCSPGGTGNINFDIFDDRSDAIDLLWVDGTCTERAYGVIQPGQNQNQMTYIGHVWRVRDDVTKALLAEFVLTAQANYTVTIY